MSKTFDQLRAHSSPDTRLAAPLNMRPLYFSTRRFARIVGFVFVGVAAVAWIAAGYDLGEIRTLAREDGAALDTAAKLAHAEAGRRIAIAQLVCAALLAALFVPWLHQARANLRALGTRRLRFGREWTYLAFAIPVLNAWRPYQVVSEVWRASDPASTDPVGWQRLPGSRLVLAWWVGLAAWIAIEAIAALLFRVAPGLHHVQIAHAISFLGDAGAALSASLGYFLVARITAAQDEKWAALGLGDRVLLPSDTARVLPSAFGARI
jgi:hypothetical protein